MGQSCAILRALGMKYGYYSEDPIEMWQIDSTIDAVYDFFPRAAMVHFSPTEEARAECLKNLTSEHMPKFFEIIERRLEGKTYVAGQKLSIADFALGALLSQTVHNKANPHSKAYTKIANKFPRLTAYYKQFAADNAKHLKARTEAFF